MASVSSHPDVEVRGSKGSGAAGRSLYATKSFAPGDLIATFTDPILGDSGSRIPFFARLLTCPSTPSWPVC